MGTSYPNRRKHEVMSDQQTTKQFFHPDGTLRLECCQKCHRDLVQVVDWERKGYDPTLNTIIFAFDLHCPECDSFFSAIVEGEVAAAYNLFMHNQKNNVIFAANDLHKKIDKMLLTETAIWIDKFVVALRDDHITPEDF